MRLKIALLLLLATGVAVATTVNISPNMGMPVPVVGSTPGPEWANDINASLSIIDSHDHTSGHGVQIPPAGLNINSDLPFGNNNETQLRSTRFTAQASPLALSSDLGALYESGVDLYYNDGSGNQIRITQGGSVTGSAGTITGLPSGTASASFGGSTFTFQSATNTPANMAVGPLIIGANTVSPHTVTIAPPGGLGANYNLALPSGLPASTSVVTLDASGNLASTTGPTLTNPTINGAALSGTLSGNPTFNGNVVFSGSIALSGLPPFAGNAKFNDDVGIGIAPINRLDVLGGVVIGAGAGSIAAPTNGLFVSGPTGIRTSIIAPGNGMDVGASMAIGLYAGVNSAPSNGVIISGNVGIGTPTPTATLHVAGNEKVDSVIQGSTGGNTPHACTRRTMSVNPGSLITVSCSAGEIVLGGGCLYTAGTGTLVWSYPDTTASWTCNYTTNGITTAYAICCSI